MITKICPQCGGLFIAKYKTQIFCSKKCCGTSLSRKVEFTCPVCGKTEYIYKGAKKFCSPKCSGIAKHLDSVVLKICPVCGKSFESKAKVQKFCSKQCSYVGRDKPSYSITEEDRLARSNKLKQQWQDESFRQSVIDRMKTNNPVYMPGVVEKANVTRAENNKLQNNFKYGNGKISPYEQIVKDKIESLGFTYNYAIRTKVARAADPDAHYAVDYKPDFVNLENKLCIEIDGYGHSTVREKQLDAKKRKMFAFSRVRSYTIYS